MLYTLEVQPTLIEKIQDAKDVNPQMERIRVEVQVGKAPGFMIHSITQGTKFYSFRPRHYIPTWVLAKVIRGVWGTTTFQYSLPPSYRWVD